MGMTMRLLCLVALTVSLGCGDSNLATGTAQPTHDAAPGDGAGGASAGDSAPDGGAGDASTSYVRICVGDEDEVQGVNCVPPVVEGGLYGACREEGEEYEAKVLGAGCCEGLTAVDTLIPADLEAVDAGAATLIDGVPCAPTAPPSIRLCTRCGDGDCGTAENPCNCAADCR